MFVSEIVAHTVHGYGKSNDSKEGFAIERTPGLPFPDGLLVVGIDVISSNCRFISLVDIGYTSSVVNTPSEYVGSAYVMVGCVTINIVNTINITQRTSFMRNIIIPYGLIP